jgi:hypothetical protein
MMVDVRKMIVSVEEIYRESGPRQSTPLRIAMGAAVVKNPYAGRYVDDVMPFMAELRALGADLSRRMINALGNASVVEAYGKGAIVGVDGDMEHGALWHEAGGWAMREALGGPKAIVPAAKMVGAAGARLMIPLGHIHAAYVRSHFNATEMGVVDGPRPGEILYGLAMATGGRIEARCGGLAVKDIAVMDGQR